MIFKITNLLNYMMFILLLINKLFSARMSFPRAPRHKFQRTAKKLPPPTRPPSRPKPKTFPSPRLRPRSSL